jgi:hypothetical protein
MRGGGGHGAARTLEVVGDRGDRERSAAQRAYERAETEREQAEQHGVDEWAYREYETIHRDAASTHERAAELFDAHDDPDVPEEEAVQIADRVIRDKRTDR